METSNDLASLMYLRDRRLLKGLGPRKALQQIDKDLIDTSNNPILVFLKIEILFEKKNYRQVIHILENTDYRTDDNFAALYYSALHGLGKLQEANSLLLQKMGELKGDHRINFLEKIENKGVQSYENGDVNVSKQIFEQVLQVEPTRARSLNNLAFLLICTRQWDQALELLAKAEQTNYPDLDVLLTNRGYIYLCQKLYEQSIQTFQSAICESSKDNEAILHVAFPWNDDIFQDKSVDYPTRMVNVITAIQANLATAFYLGGNIEKAFIAARAAIDNDPGDFIGYRVLGCLHYTQGDFEFTRQMWKKALRSNKTKAEAQVIKNWLGELPQEDKTM